MPPGPGLDALNERVAAAVEAWLTDPRDPRVYARLVSSVDARRAALAELVPRLVSAVPVPEVPTAEADGDDGSTDEGSDEDDTGSVRPMGELLGADVRAALDRLRRG